VRVRALFFVETPHRLAGAQRSLLAQLSRISAHGIDPLAVFPAPGVVEEAYRAAGVPTKVLQAPPSLLLFNKKLLTYSASRRALVLVREILPYSIRLARLIRDGRHDVVHFNSARGVLIGALGAKLARRPTVMHVRGSPDGVSRSLWNAAELLADRIVLVARALEVSVGERYRARCTVVHNGVDVPTPRDRIAARAALAGRIGRPNLATSDQVLFVSLSSVVPFKGLHHLLTAAAELRDRGVRAHHVFAGGGGDERYHDFILARRRELGLEDIVDIVGFVPDPLAMLAAADALVLPSVWSETLAIDGEVIDVKCTEGLPRSILEALSLGVPVVATRIVGVGEQIDDGVTGWMVPPSDPKALADAMEKVALDPSWRDRAGAAARAVALARFTVDKAAAGLAAVLHGVVRL
jgi:glycosyltransferase involved in cell wall biosynthesis